jgi:LysM domain
MSGMATDKRGGGSRSPAPAAGEASAPREQPALAQVIPHPRALARMKSARQLRVPPGAMNINGAGAADSHVTAPRAPLGNRTAAPVEARRPARHPGTSVRRQGPAPWPAAPQGTGIARPRRTPRPGPAALTGTRGDRPRRMPMAGPAAAPGTRGARAQPLTGTDARGDQPQPLTGTGTRGARALPLTGTAAATGARRAELPAPRPGARPVRLTRRGRLVVTGLILAGTMMVAALAWLALAGPAQAGGPGGRPGSVYQNLTTVVVRPGQTLWSIAMRAEPGADPRVVVREIADLNALPGTVVEPGQQLLVPRNK